jgi:hypothetical protein
MIAVISDEDCRQRASSFLHLPVTSPLLSPKIKGIIMGTYLRTHKLKYINLVRPLESTTIIVETGKKGS